MSLLLPAKPLLRVARLLLRMRLLLLMALLLHGIKSLLMLTGPSVLLRVAL